MFLLCTSAIRMKEKGYYQTVVSVWNRAEVKMTQVECICSAYSNFLINWSCVYEGHVTRQACIVVRFTSGNDKLDWSYMAGIPQLAHGLSVKLSPSLLALALPCTFHHSNSCSGLALALPCTFHHSNSCSGWTNSATLSLAVTYSGHF